MVTTPRGKLIATPRGLSASSPSRLLSVNPVAVKPKADSGIKVYKKMQSKFLGRTNESRGNARKDRDQNEQKKLLTPGTSAERKGMASVTLASKIGSDLKI